MSAVDTAPIETHPVKRESTLKTILHLWPYLWPSDRPDLKRRVAIALGVLIAAKVVTVLIPYTYKWATDALTAPPTTAGNGTATVGLAVVFAVPIMLIVAYGLGRILMTIFNNLRDALFARVGQHAVRQLAYKTFVHMHELSLRYHLQRRTGGLSRIIERGVRARVCAGAGRLARAGARVAAARGRVGILRARARGVGCGSGGGAGDGGVR
jgi:ATP-binding cassette subfamily B protein